MQPHPEEELGQGSDSTEEPQTDLKEGYLLICIELSEHHVNIPYNEPFIQGTITMQQKVLLGLTCYTKLYLRMYECTVLSKLIIEILLFLLLTRPKVLQGFPQSYSKRRRIINYY